MGRRRFEFLRRPGPTTVDSSVEEIFVHQTELTAECEDDGKRTLRAGETVTYKIGTNPKDNKPSIGVKPQVPRAGALSSPRGREGRGAMQQGELASPYQQKNPPRASGHQGKNMKSVPRAVGWRNPPTPSTQTQGVAPNALTDGVLPLEASVRS